LQNTGIFVLPIFHLKEKKISYRCRKILKNHQQMEGK